MTKTQHLKKKNRSMPNSQRYPNINPLSNNTEDIPI